MGDEVVVAPGDYTLATPLSILAASHLHGADGQPRPVIHGATGATPLVTLTGAGATLRHVVVRQDGGTSAVTAQVVSTLSDVVLQNSTNGGSAATLGGGAVMAGSTALATGTPGQAIDVTGGAATLHNVTAWATGGGGSSAIRIANGASAVATNTIARAPGGSDLSGAGLPTMIASNFGGAPAPLLANPNAGDFHELSGSPTIDAGLADPLAGLTDIDGDPRILGAAQDMGADEFVSHRPASTTGSANGTTVTGTVNPNGLPTTYRFDFGLLPVYGSSTPAAAAGAGTAPVPVTATLPGLTPGTLVHYRVVASNADGDTPGLDRVLIVPGTPTGAAANLPRFTGIAAPTTATAGQPIQIQAAGADRNDPVNSIAVDFDDGPGFFAESACRLRPRNRAFKNSRRSSFKVPYTFSRPGVHTVKITLGSGKCGVTRQRTTQSVQVNVLPASAKRLAKPATDAAVAVVAAAAAGCKGQNALPTNRNRKIVQKATLCLLNRIRRQYHLSRFRVNSELTRAAAIHSKAMLRGHFFAHQGPGEASLGSRFRRVRYRGGGGENLAVGVGTPYATPASMVVAWMHSPVHRANILQRQFHTIGIRIDPRKPAPAPPVPGATYTTEFGTTRR